MAKRNSSSDNIIGTIVIVAIGLAVWFWVIPDKFKYAMEYDIPEAQVYVQDKPHDCEWDKAPIGNKYCHFREHVEPVKDNNGKVTTVYVSWEKIQE